MSIQSFTSVAGVLPCETVALVDVYTSMTSSGSQAVGTSRYWTVEMLGTLVSEADRHLPHQRYRSLVSLIVAALLEASGPLHSEGLVGP